MQEAREHVRDARCINARCNGHGRHIPGMMFTLRWLCGLWLINRSARPCPVNIRFEPERGWSIPNTCASPLAIPPAWP
jgi:hypothetical protein